MKFVIGITWDPRLGFRFADVLADCSGANVEVIGARFPRKQPRFVKYSVVWPLYVLVSLRLFIKSWSCDRVICWQQAYGVSLGFLFHALQFIGVRPKASIDVLTFILTPSKRQGLWLSVLAFSLSADAVKKVVVYNLAEYDLYKKLFPKVAHKFAYTLYPAADVPETFISKREVGDFYLAVGRSNRDHEFLRDYFQSRQNRSCYVLTDQKLQSKSGNFFVVGGVFGDEYFDYLRRCKAVIIPFLDPTASSGQLVYLQAMQLGKPVLVSVSRCLEGYLLDGVTGIYFEKTFSGMDVALERVENSAWYADATARCAADYGLRFGFLKLARDYCSILAGVSVVS
ncbi:glycosyltransferase family 1 protein [Aquabacterium soli]|uniref:Glycosyltransferase family 1 protein n=1 Tax=Aquabacterium soli TaxID=2493092 RepID=A0A3R8SYE3_9BURK|nr:glycosyltransferase [Aquabacterium soli]RRR99934.1 glycosyltransferase family 1 protein [Aquabacterium soli]